MSAAASHLLKPASNNSFQPFCRGTAGRSEGVVFRFIPTRRTGGGPWIAVWDSLGLHPRGLSGNSYANSITAPPARFPGPFRVYRTPAGKGRGHFSQLRRQDTLDLPAKVQLRTQGFHGLDATLRLRGDWPPEYGRCLVPRASISSIARPWLY